MHARHARLTELFTAALELDGDARQAWLDGVAAEDEALAAELAALLSADGRPHALATGALAVTSLTGDAEPATAGPVAIPGYRVLDVLGEGGLGVVHEAEQDSPRRRVAIKVLHARRAGARGRFAREAAILARLDHPGIVRVIESGEAEGRPYLVMERVEGTTLREHVRVTGAPLRTRVALLAEVCDAVHHAHLKGVIHRDLKPSNVMVRRDGRPAVLDFGIARLVDGEGAAETRAGELIGTPLYMSPEQARLRPEEVDARSDVYALGVMLYELACGELPYEVRGRPLPEVMRAICDDDPVPLGRRDPSLAGDLEAIAGKALAKRPEDRYVSAAALADDLRRFVDRRPVSARSPGALEQAWRLARRRPLTAAALAAAVASAAAAAVVITSLWLDARRARDVAEAARDRSEAAQRELEARTDRLTVDKAEQMLAADPTEALRLLGTLRTAAVDPWEVATLGDVARGLGVASDILRGHTDEVRWVEPVAGGRGVVTASYDGRALLWTPPFGEPRRLFAGEGRSHIARPSPDGRRVAIGRDDGQAVVVEIATGAVTPLVAHQHDVERLAWSPDGRWLVTGDDHGGVWLWPDGRPPGRRLSAPEADVEALGFTDDGGAVYAGDLHGRMRLWPLATPDRPIVAPTEGHEVLAAWADAAQVVAACEDGSLWRWRRADGGLVRAGVVRASVDLHIATIAPGGALALLGGDDGEVIEIDGDRVMPLVRHGALVRAVAIAPGGHWLAAGSDDGALDAYDRATGRRVVLRGHTQRLRQLAFDGDVLYSADGAGLVRRWALDAIPPSALLGGRAVVEQLAASPDGARLASVDDDGAVRVLGIGDGAVREVGRTDGRIAGVGFAGDRVVTAGVEGALAWWSAAGAPVRRQVAGPVGALATSADGRWVAAASADAAGTIDLFDGAGAPLGSLAAVPGGANAVALDPGGTLLAAAGQDRAIHVWRLGDGAPAAVATLAGPTGDTKLVAFSPDGRLLVAAGNDGVVRGWAVEDGAPGGAARVLARHDGVVDAIAFDAAGRTLVSSGRDRRLVRVDLAGGATAEHTLAEPALAVALAGGDVLALDASGALTRWRPDGGIAAWSAAATTLAATPAGAFAGTRHGLVLRIEAAPTPR